MGAKKITVIGAGAVGSTTAYALALKGLADEIVLIDVNTDKALGEAMDIRQGAPLFERPVSVHAGNYESAEGSDVVIITSGIARKPGQTRIDLVKTNVEILKSIAPQITDVCPYATYIIVSNPVDILTYVFCKITSIPSTRVIGSGTALDTARLRSRVSEYLQISPKNVHAYVFGEHGNSSFVPWSIAQIASLDKIWDYKSILRLEKRYDVVDINYEEIERYIRESGAEVIARKGCTNYAVSTSVCELVENMLDGFDSVATVSTLLDGQYGLREVCLSIPTLIGHGEVRGHITPALTDSELEKLMASAEVLRGVIAQLDI